jgi:hypothetical protein
MPSGPETNGTRSSELTSCAVSSSALPPPIRLSTRTVPSRRTTEPRRWSAVSPAATSRVGNSCARASHPGRPRSPSPVHFGSTTTTMSASSARAPSRARVDGRSGSRSGSSTQTTPSPWTAEGPTRAGMPSPRTKARNAACPLAARLVTPGGGGAAGGVGASRASTAAIPSERQPTTPSATSQRREKSAGPLIPGLRRARS